MVNDPAHPDTTRCDVCGRSLSEKSAGLVEQGCIFCEGETDG